MPSARKPTILFLSPWELRYAGGVNQVIINLFRQAQLHGAYRPLILVNSWRHRNVRQCEVDGRSTIFLRLRSAWDPTTPVRNFGIYIVSSPLWGLTLARFLKQHAVEIVVVQYPTLAALNLLLLKKVGLFRGKVVLTFQGLDIQNAHDSRGLERMMWVRLLKWSDYVTACSENLMEQVKSFYPPCGDKAVTIHNGIDMDNILAEMDTGFTLASEIADKTLIVNVATFEHKKGQDILLHAFAEIANSFPNTHLILIGRSGPVQTVLLELIAELGLEDRVTMYTDMPHNQVTRVLRNATLFVMPSRAEPFGIALLEAGAFSLPVIAAKVGGIPEFIVHDVTGRLVPSEDVSALAREMTDLLLHPADRERLGTNLRDLAASKFAWPEIYLQYIKLL